MYLPNQTIFSFRIFVCAIFLMNISSYAHEKHHPHHNHHHHKDGKCCSSRITPHSTDESPETKLIKDALETFHEAVEGDHSHASGVQDFVRSIFKRSTWKRWVQGFNLREIGINSYRAYKIKTHVPGAREHALNLVFLIPISHMLEMLSGPIASVVASEVGASTTTVYGLGTLGAIISIPGLDPLCILIFSTYPLKPAQSTITFLRKGTVNMIKYAGHFLGLMKVWNFLTKTQDPFIYLEQIFSQASTEESKFKWHLENSPGNQHTRHLRLAIHAENQTVIEMVFNGEEDIYLEKVIFNVNSSHLMSSLDLSAALNPFHWNVREAIKKAFHDAETNHERKFYVEDVSMVDGNKHVTFKPHAVPMPKRTTFPWFSRVRSSCQNLLK